MSAFLLAALLAGTAGAVQPAARPAAPPAARAPRAELDGLQAAVESAVTRVSRPAGLMFGRPGRAYHLKGYGAFVVLAPRALPRAPRAAADDESRAFAELLGHLEQSIAEVRDPAERRRLQETVAALRGGGIPGRRGRVFVPRPRPAGPARDPASVQEAAEAFRREAERAMERAEREVRVRLRTPDEDGSYAFVIAPEVPEVPETLPPPPPPVVAPPAPPAVTAPVMPPFPPGVPGWSFEFDEPWGDEAPPDRVVSDVRRAIVTGLAGYRGGLTLLGPDEFVVVAVDFVPRMADRARPRTVVARARKRDLAEHRAGRLTAEALQARVAFDEY